MDKTKRKVVEFFLTIPALICAFLLVYYGYTLKNEFAQYFQTIIEKQGKNFAGFSIPPVFLIIAAFLIILSVLLFLFYMYDALLGTRIENRTLMLLYIGLVGLAFVIQVAATLIVFIHGVDLMPKQVMTDSMSKYYDDASLVHFESVQFWDYLQTNLECCGIESNADWATAIKAPTTDFIPKSCCDLSTGVNSLNCKINNETLPEGTIFTQGCLSKFEGWKTSLGVMVFLTGLFELVGIFLAYMIVRGIRLYTDYHGI